MQEDVSKSVVLIHSGKANDQNFGTGFLIYQDACVAYVATCAHVVRAVGRDDLLADGRSASVVAEDAEDGFDLAVLKIEPLSGYAALRPGSGQTGGAFATVGFAAYGKQKPAQTLSCVLAEPVDILSPALQRRIKGWKVEIRNNTLEPGNSGSPVVDAVSGCVIGFLTTRKEAGKHGLAVSIDALRHLQWENRPAELFNNDLKAYPHPRTRSSDLMNFITEIETFERIANGEDTQTCLIRVHGPNGGEGKTRLLQEYELIAKEFGLGIIRVDFGQPLQIEEFLHHLVGMLGIQYFPQFTECYCSGEVNSSNRLKHDGWVRQLTGLFFQAFQSYPASARTVIFFDHYEKCDRAFRQWLSLFFLPGFPKLPLIAVIAGRIDLEHPPLWTAQQRRFPLNGVTIDWFFWYNDRKKAKLDERIIRMLHAHYHGRPKEFVESVSIVQSDRFEQRFQQAASEEERAWVITEMLLDTYPPDVKEAVIAAAVPHFFDADILTALLQIKPSFIERSFRSFKKHVSAPSEATRLYQAIQTIPFTERLGDFAHALHDLTRAAILKYLYTKKPELFVAYQQRAFHYFQKDEQQYAFEILYHFCNLDDDVMPVFRQFMEKSREAENFGAIDTLLRYAREWTRIGMLSHAETIEIEAQEYEIAQEFVKKGEQQHSVEFLLRAMRLFNPAEDITCYRQFESSQLHKIIKQKEEQFLQQKLDAARLLRDPLRQKLWLGKSAWASIRNNNYKNAERQIDEALALVSEKLDEKLSLHLNGMIAYYQTGRYAEVIDSCNTLLEYTPDFAAVLAFRGKANWEIGNSSEAFADLNRAIELDPKDIFDALPKRGEAYLESDQYIEAIADFNRAITIDPENPQTFVLRGMAYAALKQDVEALADFDQAIKIDQNNAVALWARCNAYYKVGRYAEALADVDLAIRTAPIAEVLMLVPRGKAYTRLGRHAEALADFNRAIELDPTNGSAFENLGIVHYASGQYADAISDFSQAIEIEPDNIKTFIFRGLTYQALEQYTEAITDFDRVLENNPDVAIVLQYRGEVYQSLDQYIEAIADLTRSLKIEPNDADVWAQRGEAYRQSGKYSEAISDFDQALELEPNDVWTLAMRGEAYRMSGKYAEAITDFSRSLEFESNDAWALAMRGEAYLQSGQYQDALQDFNKMIELEATQDWEVYERGLAYLALQQSEPAQRDFAEAIRLAQTKYQAMPATIDEWRNFFNLAIYHLAIGHEAEAEHMYQSGATMDVPEDRLRAAIEDLNDFLRLFPEHTQAQALRALLQQRLDAMLAHS